MTLKRNAHQNVQSSINELKNIEQNLTNATQTVENPRTKEMIQNELTNVQAMINKCESIENILATDRYPGNTTQ
ncbi:hypothetical protein [Oceanirhabdus sp. W0125-5]|uniref:hypothetical protein n=1 Tax=Oceanirhabdus sp. W0125-5 TaxID=2999116 RepID=UPI0022F33ADD|nr:hypothetical protein [Oceanirhabdus sp. W0125-5]WBW95494.1 hypothetical protein OW730_17590 [Oceanirhabdus sp. W0125-5]